MTTFWRCARRGVSNITNPLVLDRRGMRHSVPMRLFRLGVTLLLAGVCVVGCASEAEKEPEASAEELFCAAFRDYYERSSEAGGQQDAEVVASMKAFAEEASSIEPPESMSSDAKAGLATWLTLMEDVPDDATQEDVAALGQDLSAKQVEQLDAYYLYSNARCLSANAG